MEEHEYAAVLTEVGASPKTSSTALVGSNTNQEDVPPMDGTDTNTGTTTLFLDLYPGCDVCGRDHLTEECPELGLNTSTGEFKLTSKARLTLPSNLVLLEHMDASLTVVTQQVIPSKTQFGPFEARRTTENLDAENVFNLKILAKDGTTISLDTSNENNCNWMCLVQCAENEEEQNCIAYQMGTNIFYSTIKNILQGEQLKVWYASYYAKKLGRPVKPTKNYKVMLSAEQSKSQDIDSDIPILQHLTTTEPTVNADEAPLTAMSEKMYRHRILSLIRGEEVKEYKCSRCNETFDNQVDLAKHLRAHLVPNCSTRTSKVRIRKSRFHCTICNIGFVNKSNWQRHTRRHKGQVLRCLKCGHRTYRLDVMWNHLLSKHDKEKIQSADQKSELFEYEDQVLDESEAQSLNQDLLEEEEGPEEGEREDGEKKGADQGVDYIEVSQTAAGLPTTCLEEGATPISSNDISRDKTGFDPSLPKEDSPGAVCDLDVAAGNDQMLIQTEKGLGDENRHAVVHGAPQDPVEKPDITKIALMEAKITLEDGELDFKEKDEEMNEAGVPESFEGFSGVYIKESGIGEFIHTRGNTNLVENIQVPSSTTAVQIVQVSKSQSHERIPEIYDTIIKAPMEESEKQILAAGAKCDNYLVRAVEGIEISESLQAANVVCHKVDGNAVIGQSDETFERNTIAEDSVITGTIIKSVPPTQPAEGYIVEESVITGDMISQQGLVVSESIVTSEAITPTIVSQAVLQENIMCSTADEVTSTPAFHVRTLDECPAINTESKCIEGDPGNLMSVEVVKSKDLVSAENAECIEVSTTCDQQEVVENKNVTISNQDQPNKLIEFVDYVADVIRQNEETEAQNQTEESCGTEKNVDAATVVACNADNILEKVKEPIEKSNEEQEPGETKEVIPDIPQDKEPIPDSQPENKEPEQQEANEADRNKHQVKETDPIESNESGEAESEEEPKKRRPGRPRKRTRLGILVGKKLNTSADVDKASEPMKKKSKESPQRLPVSSPPVMVVSPPRVLPSRRLKGIRTTGNKAVESEEEKNKIVPKPEVPKPKKLVTESLKPGLGRRRGRPPKFFKLHSTSSSASADNASDASSLQSATKSSSLSPGLKTKSNSQTRTVVSAHVKRKLDLDGTISNTSGKSSSKNEEPTKKNEDSGEVQEKEEVEEKKDVKEDDEEEEDDDDEGKSLDESEDLLNNSGEEEMELNDDSNPEEDDKNKDVDMLIDKTEDGLLYACCICGKKFTNIKYLKLHAPAHTDRFRCEMCGKRFTRKESLTKHRCDKSYCSTILETGDSEKVNFTCGECGKTFTKPEYAKRHFAMHTDIWKCEKCGRQFSRRHLLASHVCNGNDEEGKNSQHQCDICEQSFRTVKYLYRHLAMHTDIFKCEQCGRCFSRKDSMQKHILRCDPKRAAAENIHSCPKCSRTFSTKLGLENHLLHCFMLECYKCNQSFSLRQDLKDHVCTPRMEEVDKNKVKRMICQVCNKTFANLRYLHQHEATHKGTFQCDICMKGFSRNEELNWHRRLCIGESAINRDGFVACNKCDSKFEDAKDYREHYQRHTHPFDCLQCGKLFVKRGTLKTHSCHPLQEEVEARCEICYKTFRSEKYLIRHQIIHGEPQFECEVCHKKFYRKDYLNDHSCLLPDGTLVRVVRRQNQVFIRDNLICHLCGKSFVSVSNLNKHLKCHGEKTCECNICGKRFHYITYLKEHKAAVHENKYQHQCAECGKIVKTKTSLVSHMKQFHSDVPPKYACKTCGKVFRQKGNMKTHMFSHSQEKLFACTYCGKKFKYPDQLNRHRLEHTMTNKLQCEHCEKKFVKGYELRKHIQIFHSGLVYMCDSCNAKCGHRHTLIRHYKRKHPDKVYLLRDPSFLGSLLHHVEPNEKDLVKSEPDQAAKNEETIITLGADTSLAVAAAEGLLPQMAAEALHSLSSTMFTTQSGDNIQVPEMHPAIVEEDGSHTVVILQFVNQGEEGEEETVICRQEVATQQVTEEEEGL